MSAEKWEWLPNVASNDVFCLATRIAPSCGLASDYIVRTTQLSLNAEMFRVEILRRQAALPLEVTYTRTVYGWENAMMEHFDRCRILEHSLSYAWVGSTYDFGTLKKFSAFVMLKCDQ